MKGLFNLFILFGLICAVAYFTKPSEVVIREKARQHFLSKANAGPKGSTKDYIAGGLAKLAAEKSIAIKDRVLYKEVNYLLTGDLKGIGIFGTVFFY